MKKILLCALVLITMMVCFSGCFSGSDEFDEFDALALAESEVEKILKAPSTADFSPYSETTISNSGNEWTVKGWVDAENGFGAKIRSTYYVNFTMTGDDYYTVNYCYVD